MTLCASQRVQKMEPSATIGMAAKARALKQSGKTVFDFTLGEPDFNTPEHICRAATLAMQQGHTHYTPAAGIPELKQAICDAYSRRHGLSYSPGQVVVSCGAKHSLNNIFTTLCNPGDEVIIPAPYWVSYAELVRLSEGVPVILQTAEASGFKLSPQALDQAITSKTKALVLCSPSNPTGTTYTPDELAALAEVTQAKGVTVIADEIYEHLLYGGVTFASFPTVRPKLAENTILVNGVSKSYAMTGWRIGWTLSPAAFAQAMGDLQSQQTSNPSSVSQYAALAALSGPQDCVETMRQEFARRREFVIGKLSSIAKLSWAPIDGAFYAFINIKAYLGKKYAGQQVDTTAQWCLKLLEDAQVATVMGSAFGAEGYVRMSFATSTATLEQGLNRMSEFLASAQ